MTSPTWKTTAPTIDLDALPAEPASPPAGDYDAVTPVTDVAAAIATGAIPTFDDPATHDDLPLPPIDITAETSAYADLIALITAHKDDDTTVSLLDPDAFADGLD